MLQLSVAVLFAVFGSSTSDADTWSSQLNDLKQMIERLDAKVTALDEKLANVQFLEYAFRVSQMDGNLKTIDTKLQQLSTKVGSLEESSKSSCAISKQVERTNSAKVTNDALMDKIEDFGQKTVVANFEILQLLEKQQNELDITKNLSRSGFSKLYRKMDLALEMEGQVTIMAQNLNVLSPRIVKMTEQLSSVSTDLQTIKPQISRNTVLLQNVTRTIKDEGVGGKGGTSDAFEEAFEIATRVRKQLSEMAEVVELSKMSGKLDTGGEKSFEDLMTEVSEDFQELHAILSRGPKSFCNNQFFQCEQNKMPGAIDALKELFENKNIGKGNSAEKNFGCAKDFLQNLSEIRISANHMGVGEKLRFISNEMSSLHASIRRQCNCD